MKFRNNYKLINKYYKALSCIVLLSMSCNHASKHSNPSTRTPVNQPTSLNKTKANKPNRVDLEQNNPKTTKLLLSVKEANPSQSTHYYLNIRLKPPGIHEAIEQYFLSAQNLVGHGELLGAQEKYANQFQYVVSLAKEQGLNKLLPGKGHAALFKSGKQLCLKCQYKPGKESQQGDIHQLLVQVRRQDDQGKINQEAQTVVELIIKNDRHKPSKTIKKPGSVLPGTANKPNKTPPPNVPYYFLF